MANEVREKSGYRRAEKFSTSDCWKARVHSFEIWAEEMENRPTPDCSPEAIA